MVMNSMLPVKTADDLAREEAQAAALPVADEQKISLLSGHIKTIWERVKTAKEPIAAEMIECLRARKGEYSPTKLKEIRSIRSSEVYLKLTKTKCRSGEAWIRDIIEQPSQKPWAIEPTPEPELPPEIEAQLTKQFYQTAIMQFLTDAMMNGQPLTFDVIQEQIEQMKPEFERRLKQMIYDKAKERCLELEKVIDDALVEGGFYTALDQIIYDIVTFKACCIKGPVFRKEKVKKVVTDPQTGMLKTVAEERIISQYDRVNPFDIFPDKNAKNIQDGDLIERTYYRPDVLANLIGVPGYKEDQIRAVLKEWEQGGLKDWQTNVDQERAEIENNLEGTLDKIDTNLIPCLIWWGLCSGKKLKEWGLQGELQDEMPYHATAFLIGDHVIKAMLNYDPVGEKPYSSTSFDYSPDSVWGESVPELIEDIQAICNATARALVNNVGIASGPMVEVNRDRFPDDFDPTLWAWKIFESENSQMTQAPAVTFYAPPMVVEKLIMVFTTFSKVADEHSGIPAYAHGDPQVGGAGNTASGLSMLMTSAARGIKGVIKNLDLYVISPIIQRQFEVTMEINPRPGILGDIKIVARGSSQLASKEQQGIRLMEFARETNNPLDVQITGIEGRKYILKTAASALNIDGEKAFQGQAVPIVPPGALPPGNNAPGPSTLDASGRPVQGTDTREFNEKEKK